MLDELASLGSEGAVRLDRDTPVGRLLFDNPSRSNAMSGPMLRDFKGAVEELEGWDGLAVVLRGAGDRSFCAGADRALVRAALDRPELGRAMCSVMQDLTARLNGAPVISVAAIEGAAVGGGAEMATAADFRVMSRTAHIRFVHARLGLSPGWGGGGRLLRLVGRRHALRLLATARRVSADEALDLGLVDVLCEPGHAEAAAREFLAPFVRLPKTAVRGAKRLVANPDEEGEVFGSLWGEPAMRAAFSPSDAD